MVAVNSWRMNWNWTELHFEHSASMIKLGWEQPKCNCRPNSWKIIRQLTNTPISDEAQAKLSTERLFPLTFHPQAAVVKMMLYFGSVMLPAESAFTRGDDSDRFHDDFYDDILIPRLWSLAPLSWTRIIAVPCSRQNTPANVSYWIRGKYEILYFPRFQCEESISIFEMSGSISISKCH